ncbi:hypothetical protein J5N97_027314 [Dioscorea zingiberensis]|uniref:Bromo domain-containing protein n=1 Tax=Dioscorea zingiberensis TaxID=325984 RepID=A0A9D5C3T0_9LILI|nr:hypothetical protein J5N97_027314 [Dioscorea zingiberensis]
MGKSAVKKKSRRLRRDLPPPPPPPPPVGRRALRPRRRRIPIPDDFINSSSDDEERGKRKLKLVLKLPHAPARHPPRFPDFHDDDDDSDPATPPSSPSSESFVDDDDEEEEEEVKPLKKRRIEGSAGSGHHEEKRKNPSSKIKDRVQGVCNGSRTGTRLPNHKILEMVLDKLQKKDTYGVFAEPVDPEELPDYHDVIEHPMDFGTIRKKLARNAYRCFEQFEDDVFLICSNAMQYNAPDTIYFRQARSIQEMARKKFQTLRTDGAQKMQTFCGPASSVTERKFEEKINSNSCEKKLIKKPVCIPSKERLGSDISSGATLPLAQDTFTVQKTAHISGTKKSSNVNRSLDGSPPLVESKSEKADEISARCSPTQFGPKVLLVDENHGGNDSTLKEEPLVESDSVFTVSAKCSPYKIGRKPLIVDENRRATYSLQTEEQVVESDLIFAVLGSEPKQLTAVEDYVEYSYARSLARFAGSLGPVAWKIASEKIEKALPSGIKFGPGWVGEYEPLPTPILSFENHIMQLGHSSKLRKQKENEGRTKVTQNGGLKDMQVGRKMRMVSSQCNGSSNQMKEGASSRGPTGGKQGWFGVAAENKSNITFAMLQEQKDRLAVDLPKAPTNLTEHLRACNPTSVIPTETTVQRPLSCPEAATSRSLETILRNNNHRQPENLKQHETRKPERGNVILGMDLRGYIGGNVKENSDINRLNTSLGIISSHQSKVTNNGMAHGSQEQPIMGLSGKISYQSNVNVGGHTLTQVSSPLQQARRENVSAAAVAAQAWMSIGAPAEHKSVDYCGLPRSQVGSAPLYNSFWKMPAAVTGVNEDAKTRQMPQVLPQPIQVVSEESHVKNQGFVFFPQLLGSDSSRHNGQSPWQCLAPHVQQRQRTDMLPPDLNISFQPPGSPVRQSSGILMDSQQPDLALQL